MLSASFANLGRPVVDRTSLEGEFNFDLETNFAPASANPNAPDGELRWTPDPGATTAADAPPGLVTAVREQLGLRLQSGTAQMEHLVIDSVERPQPD